MQKIYILTRFCSLAMVLINIQKSPSFLVALFAVCCSIFIKTSVPRGCCIKYYLWRKKEVDTLYFSANSRLTSPRMIACKIKTSSTYRVHPIYSTRRCRLHSLFAVKFGCIIGCITLFTPYCCQWLNSCT